MKKVIFEETIYTYHIDFVGHVNNINYITWMENGRVKLLETAGIPVTEVASKEGILPILSETHICYKKPLFLQNRVTIEVWVSHIYNASMIMEFRFYNEERELCATAHQKGLFVDSTTMKPVRLKPEHREAFEKFLSSTKQP